MRYRFPYVGADLRKIALASQAFSEHCETTDTGYITRYAGLLRQLSPDTHSSLPTEGAGSG